MRNIDHNGINWKDLEGQFFSRVLKKDMSMALYNVESLFRDEVRLNDGGSRENHRATADYHEALFNASRSMIRFKKPRRLIRMINKIINEKVGVAHLAVLLYDNDKHSYILADSRGVKGRKIPIGYIRLDPKSPLISLFSERRNGFISENGVVNFK